MLRANPPGEDATHGIQGRPIPFTSDRKAPGLDDVTGDRAMVPSNQLENTATALVQPDLFKEEEPPQPAIDFLNLVQQAEAQALLYTAQNNRKAWSWTYRAFHNQHYLGSKYTTPDYRNRSNLFVPKTRTAVRKDQASVAASLFNNIDAINCLPGNEGNPKQRAAAAVIEELVNYRTDRSSGKAAIPWFLVAMGARQDSVLTGVCISKQVWKVEHRKTSQEDVLVEEGGIHVARKRDVFTLETDRPDIVLFPPENVIMDSSAEWTNPAQDSPFLILKYPMHIEEIKAKQRAPINPWKPVPEEVLRSSTEIGKSDTEQIRRAREFGLDRLSETQTGNHFKVVWVYETFVRADGEDWTFYSIGERAFLTDPKPVREVYPEQAGERPVVFGFGSLEAHRIYPMSPAESWQMLQVETNDIRNLMLDAVKQNVMPVTKVRRGRQIDLDQVKRRSSGSSIMVQDPDDVTFETPPQISQSAVVMSRELDLELDDLAGQQNYGSVETNNALGKTLGGLKLAAGAANAVQEYDIRVWLETWVAPVMSQIVRLEQYYEHDPIVLGLCGERAQLFQKHGISRIDDDLLDQEVTVRVSVGLGAGDPQQRLAKFQAATQIVSPIIQASPEFQSGKREINIEAIIEEVYGAAGYKDGGRRFFKENEQPRANPTADLATKKLEAEIAKNERMGKASLMSGLASVAKVALGKRELEADVVNTLLDQHQRARDAGFDHGHRHNQMHLSALDHGHRHGLAIANHRRQGQQQALQDQSGGDVELEGSAPPPEAPSSVPAPGGPPSASPPPDQDRLARLEALVAQLLTQRTHAA